MTLRMMLLHVLCLIGICLALEEVIQNQQLLARIEALERTVEKLSISDNCAKALPTKCDGNDLERLTKRLDVYPATPVAFSAYTNHFVHRLSKDAVIPFEKVTTNEGNAFNGDKGIFTCTKPGLYLFMWNIMVSHGYSTQIKMSVNGVSRRWSYATALHSGDTNSANHDIVRLNEGDKVWIADDYASGEIHPHHTTFSGVLLSQ